MNASQLAEICREAINQHLYGGIAPTSSNVLTEVTPTENHGAAFLVADSQYAVIVAPAVNLSQQLYAADWPQQPAPVPGHCRRCGRPVHAVVRIPDGWEDNLGQMVCPAIIGGGPHRP